FYVPVSFLFFVIGTCLYAYYQVHPELVREIQYQLAASKLPASANQESITQLASTLNPADYGDKVVPHFMVTRIPAGLLGLIISAILAAAMSTISSGMNASATVFTEDIYKRYLKPGISDRQNLKVLRIGTIAVGLLGMGAGVAMIGIKSILDIWWQLSGIFAGGVLGLFLLGVIGQKTKNSEALTATVIGVLVILWMTFSDNIPVQYDYLRSPFHIQMVIVVGTLVIFLSGLLLTRVKRKYEE
ncbi:MAG: sodium:solute symporter family transporter, partial [Flavitalea sp.]